MHPPKFYLLVFTLLPALLLTSNAEAQNALGPFDAYVSRQNPAQTRILSGEFPFKAEKGQEGKFPASSIHGPIAVDVSGNTAAGTLNEKKGRKEKTPNPKSTIRVTQIPKPGTTVPAHFLIKSENFLSWLLPKGDKPFSKGMMVKFEIHSLLLKMSQNAISVSKDGSTIVSMKRRYPVSDGSVSYQSLKNHVRLKTLSNGVRITGLGSGDDVVVATLTAGNAVYRDTIRVKGLVHQAGSLSVPDQAGALAASDQEAKKPEEKSREELIQVNQANQQEIVRLKYKINQSERILFAAALLVLAALIALGIRSYRKRVKRHNRTMDEISQMQSHKVRAPLVRILGLVQLFNSRDLTDPGNKQVITYLTVATTELDEVITEIIKKSDAYLKGHVAGKG